MLNKRRRLDYNGKYSNLYAKNPFFYGINSQIGNKQISKISHEYDYKLLTESNTNTHINIYDRSEIAFNIIEICTTDLFIICLTNCGQCLCFYRQTGKFFTQINDLHDRAVRSMHYNDIREELILCALIKTPECMKLATFAIEMQKLKQNIIIYREVLEKPIKYPGFIEFQTLDNVKYVAVTIDYETNNYKIWDLDTYSMISMTRFTDIQDIKLSNGFLLTQQKTDVNKILLKITEMNNFKVIGDQIIPEFTTPHNLIANWEIKHITGLLMLKDELNADIFSINAWSYMLDTYDILIDSKPWDKTAKVTMKNNITILMDIPLTFTLKPYRKLEFTEILNNSIFIKYRGVDCIILDILTDKQYVIKNSIDVTPGSFLFLYDQNKFMFIQPDENLSVYNTKAEKLYDFENHMLSDNNIGCIDENANVIFSKCLDNYEVKIHVSCIHTGKLLITYDDKVLGCNPELIVCMQMNKTNNEFIYADEEGIVRRIGF